MTSVGIKLRLFIYLWASWWAEKQQTYYVPVAMLLLKKEESLQQQDRNIKIFITHMCKSNKAFHSILQPY